MSRFNIPDIFKPGFDALSELTPGDFDTLLNSLKAIPIGTGRDSFIESIGKVKVDGAEDISQAIYSLIDVFYQQDLTVSKTADELADSFAEIKTELADGKRDEIANKLCRIFTEGENLRMTFKAVSLLNENEQIFRDAKIISDIRLIFNDSIEDADRYAVLIHKLKIETQKSATIEELFLSLDSTDLKKLRHLIDRAIEKERLIKEQYSNMRFVTLVNNYGNN